MPVVLRKKVCGFTIMEVLVAMTLLAAMSAVAFYSFTSSVKISSNSEPVAYNYGRGILEKMYERVRQDQWNTPGLPLSLLPNPAPQTKTLNGVTFTANYLVNNGTGVMMDANGDGDEDYRKVNLTVAW